MGHHFRREQRRARVIALVGFVILLAIAVPFFAMPRLRLDVVESLGLVPNDTREHLFDSAGGVELVTVYTETPVESSLPIRRYTAVYVAETGADGVLLHDLAASEEIVLPLAEFTSARQSPDGSNVLFLDEGARPPQAAVVTVASGDVRGVAADELDAASSAQWSDDLAFEAAQCNVISPDGGWVACAVGSPRVFGDWELYIHPTGRLNEKTHLLRGIGTTPIIGWAADSRSIYYQNEDGVFRVPLNIAESA